MNLSWNFYLSGPIAGISYDEIIGWRNELRPIVDSNIRLISPMRGKEHLKNVKFHKVIADNNIKGDDVMSNIKSVFTRDYFDVMHSDGILFNTLKSKTVSIGSVCEAAWAYQAGKIIILAIDDNPKNPHNHDFLRHMAHYTVNNLKDAAHVINQIYVGYRK